MNRLNPLYIVALLAFILGVVVWQDYKFQRIAAQKEQRLHQLESIGQKVATLKRYWKDRKLQKRRVQEFLRFVSKFVKKKEQRGNRMHIVLDGVDARSADRIADKLLNSFVKVKSIKIDRKSKEQIAMEVELAL